MTPGKIRIKDKVYFEPDGLPEPDSSNSIFWLNKNDFRVTVFDRKMKEYEASKQLIEVSNVYYGEISRKWLYGKKMKGTWEDGPINNQPCKAEVTGETCTIVELIK